MADTLRNLTNAMLAANRIALILHVSPDGDTCGSALALRRGLLFLGKDAQVFCDDPMPSIYADLDGAGSVRLPESAANETFDLAVAVDIGDRRRMGRCAAIFDAARNTAQIDHHGTNPAYAQINHIRSPLSATCLLAAEVLGTLGVPLDLPTATCLFVAAATDTGNFKNRGTDAEALALAEKCVKLGLDAEAVARRIFDVRPICQIRLMGRALSCIETFAEGRVAVMRLSGADFEETGALSEHTEGIINFAINAEGVQIACLLSEQGERVKCSFRSMPPCDVSRVATRFGGGGHALAAGCSMKPSLQAAHDAILPEMLAELERAE